MAPDLDILELKFEGNGIKPSKVRASEIADLIRSFEEAIISVLKSDNPSFNDETLLLLTVENIRHASLGLVFNPQNLKEYVAGAYATLALSFSVEFNNLPNSTIEPLRKITNFAKRHNCDGTFIRSGERLTTFTPETKVAYNEKNIIKGETIIYGEIKRLGGEVPRVTIKLDEGHNLSFDVKKEIAISLASKLYQDVGIKGVAKWDKKTYRILDFKANEVVKLKEKPLSNVFSELNILFNKHLGSDGFDAILNRDDE